MKPNKIKVLLMFSTYLFIFVYCNCENALPGANCKYIDIRGYAIILGYDTTINSSNLGAGRFWAHLLFVDSASSDTFTGNILKKKHQACVQTAGTAIFR
jgi:hypothetical protein